MARGKSYRMISLGCSKNQVDSERIVWLARENGWVEAPEDRKPDLTIINTCGFIHDAREEAIDEILEACDVRKKSGKVVVTGCLVKRSEAELRQSIPEVDAYIGLKDFTAFERLFSGQDSTNHLSPGRVLLNPGHYAYLRISDGCNNRCAYCAIPGIRGSLQSVPIPELVAEAKTLADQGVLELIITAQDSAEYGLDLYGERKLPELLRALHEIPGFRWIRVMYLHPAHITDDMIDTIADLPKICKYMDIPIQHAHNDILGAMNRKIDAEGMRELVGKIRDRIPGIVLRTTVMVGFPGETRKHFLALRDFLGQIRFDVVGAFGYSPEDGTPAADLPGRLSPRTIAARMTELRKCTDAWSEQQNERHVGKILPVIIDEKDPETKEVNARTTFQAPDIDGIVEMPYHQDAEVGKIVLVEIESHLYHNFYGNWIDQKK